MANSHSSCSIVRKNVENAVIGTWEVYEEMRGSCSEQGLRMALKVAAQHPVSEEGSALLSLRSQPGICQVEKVHTLREAGL